MVVCLHDDQLGWSRGSGNARGVQGQYCSSLPCSTFVNSEYDRMQISHLLKRLAAYKNTYIPHTIALLISDNLLISNVAMYIHMLKQICLVWRLFASVQDAKGENKTEIPDQDCACRPFVFSVLRKCSFNFCCSIEINCDLSVGLSFSKNMLSYFPWLWTTCTFLLMDWKWKCGLSLTSQAMMEGSWRWRWSRCGWQNRGQLSLALLPIPHVCKLCVQSCWAWTFMWIEDVPRVKALPMASPVHIRLSCMFRLLCNGICCNGLRELAHQIGAKSPTNHSPSACTTSWPPIAEDLCGSLPPPIGRGRRAGARGGVESAGSQSAWVGTSMFLWNEPLMFFTYTFDFLPKLQSYMSWLEHT